MSDRSRAILALRVIAATAEKLADDVESNRLWVWERKYDDAVSEIQRHMRDLPSLP